MQGRLHADADQVHLRVGYQLAVIVVVMPCAKLLGGAGGGLGTGSAHRNQFVFRQGFDCGCMGASAPTVSCAGAKYTDSNLLNHVCSLSGIS